MRSGTAWRPAAAFILLASSVILASCTYNFVRLGRQTFAVERIETTPIYVSWVNAEEKDNEMIVNGFLRTTSSNAQGTGHVDVAVISPEGRLLGLTSTDYAPKDFRKYRKQARFESRFPFVPPDRSRIRVAVHGDSGPAVNCGDNRAAKEHGQ